MLTGGPPYRGTVRSVLRQIVEEPPPRPSKKSAEKIPRDLETICLKAIERQPSDRYESAEAMAEDLQRFLTGEPILARRPNPVLRVGRFARCHPFTFAIAGVAAPSLILLTIAYAAIQNQHRLFEQQTQLIQAQRETDRQRLADETHRADAAQLRSDQVLSQSFSAVLAARQVREPDWVDTEKTVMTALLGGLEQGYQQMQLAPERNSNFGEMALALAQLRAQVGKKTESMDAYEQAIKDFEKRTRDEPTEILWQHMTNARRGYGKACRELERYDQAIEHLQAACNIAERQVHADLESLKWKLEWAMSETELAVALMAADRASQSDSHLDSAAIRIRAISMAERPQFDLVGFRASFADAAGALAQALRQRGRFDRAILIQRMAVAHTDRLGDDEMSNLKRSDAYAATSDLMVDANRPAAAMKSMRQAISSLNKAMQQSNFPGRYRKRRAELQGKIRLLADEHGIERPGSFSDRANVPTTARRTGLVLDKRRVELRAVKPIRRAAPNQP
jgi:tetratricopeptide (TPR) repeat protein